MTHATTRKRKRKLNVPWQEFFEQALLLCGPPSPMLAWRDKFEQLLVANGGYGRYFNLWIRRYSEWYAKAKTGVYPSGRKQGRA